MGRTLFKNGHLIDPSTGRDGQADILVNEDKIIDIGSIDSDNNNTVVIDLGGKLVIPGGVDLHVHLRAMKEKHKETIESGTKAARKGGITTVMAMPNTRPRLDSEKHIKKYLDLIRLSAKVDVLLAGAITEDLKGKHHAEIDKYAQFGIKFITDDGYDVDDESVFKEAMEIAKEFDLTVMVHPEVRSIAPKGVINEGAVSRELKVVGQPNEKEWKAVERAIKIATEVGCKLHLTHITTKESVQLIREAKQKSVNVTCDVTPHHIALTEDTVRSHLSMAKVNPPLRTEADRLALIHAIKDGVIDAIASDHAPHTVKEKMRSLKKAAFGFSGLEVMIPASITELHFNQGIELSKVIALLTSAPAKIADIKGVCLTKGGLANFTVIDLNNEKEVDGQQFVSLGKITAFDGMKLKGWPAITVYKGKIFEY